MVKTGASSRFDPTDFPDDIIPSDDDTFDLGSDTKKWAALYAVLAIITSMTIGGIYLSSSLEGVFLINASTYVNGSFEVSGNTTLDTLTATGLQITTGVLDLNSNNISEGGLADFVNVLIGNTTTDNSPCGNSRPLVSNGPVELLVGTDVDTIQEGLCQAPYWLRHNFTIKVPCSYAGHENVTLSHVFAADDF